MKFLTRFLLVFGVCTAACAGGLFAGMALLEHSRRQQAAPPVVAVPTADPAQPAFNPNVFREISIKSQNSRIPVIMYHDIIERRGAKSVYFDCTAAEFQQQMDWLQAQGATVISLEKLHRHLTLGEEIPDNAVVLTFDDNYEGFNKFAYPILKQRKWHSTVFVHTNYVGDKKGDHPKMDWETLKRLDSEGLVTIASHTESHPEDMRKLSPIEQENELFGSKQILESKLGHRIPYLAYPVGNQDATTQEITKKVGYTMAFTIQNGPVQESPNILALNRYVHTRLEKAWEEAGYAKKNAPATIYEREIVSTPVRLEIKRYAGVKLGLVRGGIPESRRSMVRQSVGNFVEEIGGVAGVNGTFFSDARLVGTGCQLIGPSQTPQDPEVQPDPDTYRLTRLGNRPIVIWGPKKLCIFPFNTGFMNKAEAFREFMPDYTDLFLAGAWIVHKGVARTADEMDKFSAGDFRDPRRRAFFGITKEGEIVLGGTLEVVTTMKMAEAAAAAGVEEAVLLDSGFSTSIVFNNKIIVTGHTATNIPSRPVPHSIVLKGNIERPEDRRTIKVLDDAGKATAPVPQVPPDDPMAMQNGQPPPIGTDPSLDGLRNDPDLAVGIPPTTSRPAPAPRRTVRKKRKPKTKPTVRTTKPKPAEPKAEPEPTPPPPSDPVEPPPSVGDPP